MSFSGASMLNPFIYAPSQHRGDPPDEAFDRLLEAYTHEKVGGSRDRAMGITAIPVEDARRMFVEYVSYFEGYYRSVSMALHEHMSICVSPSPIMMQMRNSNLRQLFRQGYAIHADRRSGKTAALFDEADEVSRATHSRIALVAPDINYVKAEMARRRMDNAVAHQFDRLEFVGEYELEKLNGLSHDVMVDEWFRLSERARDTLKKRFRILAAVGTYPHGAEIKI